MMTANDVSPRWVGSGWTVFNNKGKPVRQYEPFFTDTHRFEFDVKIGASPVLFYDPVERVVATLHPNHAWEKVVFNPWRQVTFDVNDTVTLTPNTDDDVKMFFLNPDGTPRIPASEYLPTWHELRTDLLHAAEFAARYPDATDRSNETSAAVKAATHAETPTTAHFDTLARPFLPLADNGPDSAQPGQHLLFATRVELDIEGNQREIIDAKDRFVMRYNYDMLSNRIHQTNMEGGARWMLNDVAGKPLYAWDNRDHRFRSIYDPLRRPTDSFLREGAVDELLVGRSVYGETRTNPEASNMRGKVVQLFDQAGVVSSDEYDFKGNLLRSKRQLAKQVQSIPAYRTTLDWSVAVQLETDTYTSRTRHDALNRPSQLISPHSDQPGATLNVIEPIYNEANLLEQMHAWLNQNAEPADWLDPTTANLHAVTNIDYNAKGQRTLIDYGNGAITTYTYDPLTFRLVHLLTLRDAVAFPNDCPQPAPAGWPGCQVQNLHYTYDPVGNITHIRDDAQQTTYFRNKRVEPSADYTYDAVYRLIEATGREQLGQVGGAPIPHSYNDASRVGLAHPGDGNAMGTYIERYVYDAVGNFLEMQHRSTDPAHPGWTRSYAYNEVSLIEPGKHSNRLSSTTVGNNNPIVEQYGYDAHGNMLHMPNLQIMQWDFKDQLQMTRRQAVNATDADGVQHQGEQTYYVYDSAGQRVRKVTELGTGQVKDERIYLGGFEIYRKNGANPLVRETLHIMDDKQRIAMVETRTQGNDPAPQQLIRYQFGNHLGSASLELDDQAQIVSYEEYTPYGSTSYQAVRSQTETSKRYRYTRKERDEESGLYYHGSRYYACWLGRWTSCDPAGFTDGTNLYAFVRANPVRLLDQTGQQGGPPGQTWFYEARVFWQRVTATAAGRGFTETIKQNAQKVYEMFGGKGTADLAHIEKPQALLRAGESTSVAPQDPSVNREYAAVDKARVQAARAKGEFTRIDKYDPTAKLGTRFPKQPQSEIFKSEEFKGWQKPTGPAGPAEPSAPKVAQKYGANPNQLELPFEKAPSGASPVIEPTTPPSPRVPTAEPGATPSPAPGTPGGAGVGSLGRLAAGVRVLGWAANIAVGLVDVKHIVAEESPQYLLEGMQVPLRRPVQTQWGPDPVMQEPTGYTVEKTGNEIIYRNSQGKEVTRSEALGIL